MRTNFTKIFTALALGFLTLSSSISAAYSQECRVFVINEYLNKTDFLELREILIDKEYTLVKRDHHAQFTLSFGVDLIQSGVYGNTRLGEASAQASLFQHSGYKEWSSNATAKPFWGRSAATRAILKATKQLPDCRELRF